MQTGGRTCSFALLTTAIAGLLVIAAASRVASAADPGSDPIDPLQFTTDARAGYDWWALQPVVRPERPKVNAVAWVNNAVDAFILAELEDRGLSPSPPADRRTLIRRLSFDLLGLPPTPEAVADFLSDTASDAYTKRVDRMLASPRYGERWARHWLDVTRFGESQGFERDKLRPHAWRFRDWVIDAFNHDLPYDEFARLQLAGDVLRPNDPSAVTATGFLVAGPYDEVGQNQQSAAMKAVVRQDELEDIVGTVGQTFLGLTVNCARCHDHKFDPVRQVEYYRLTAALAGVRHGERELDPESIRTETQIRDAAFTANIRSLTQRLAAIDEPVRRAVLALRATKQTEPRRPAQPIARWDFDRDLRDSVGQAHGTAHGKARLDAGGLQLDGRSAYVATAPLDRDVKAKTLEAWVSLSSLNQRGGGVMSLQTLDGSTFDAIVFAELEPERWMAGSNRYARTRSFNGPKETEVRTDPVHFAIVYDADGTITGFRNGQQYGTPFKSSGPVTFKAGQAQVLFGLRHSPRASSRQLAGTLTRARLYDRALTADEIAASAGVERRYVSEKEIVARITAEEQAEREHLRFEIVHLEAQRKRAGSARVYAVTPRRPEVVHLLLRGNPAQKGNVVSAGGVASLAGVDADFRLAPDAPEAQRRTRLAHWITAPSNPLFARVIVNRLWHYHFGTGLVNTPSDFGFNGGRPTHPELLDWLADELVRENWSLKSLQRTIVTSATYRQASRFNASAARADAGSRYLWRKNPRRLEAEVIRDTVLAVAGELNPTIGGPGYHDFRSFTNNTQFYEPIDPVGYSFNRRSVYRSWVRSGRNRFLDVFDCPDPSTTAPTRAVTTTPLQSLAMLNHPFVLRMADRFATRLERTTGDDVERQIRRAYALVYGRDPDRDELTPVASFVREHGLSALCRVLFNSNEFLYVD